MRRASPWARPLVAAADLLRGKTKPEFTPHVDCGDFVIVINAEKAVLTGNKATQKFYRHHSGWTGGLKEISYGTLMQKRPEFAVKQAVKGMLPKNSLGADALTRLARLPRFRARSRCSEARRRRIIGREMNQV